MEKCGCEINFSNSRDILSKLINGYNKEYCNNNAKYFEDGHWYCGKHAPSKIREREDKSYKKWQESVARRKLL